VQHSVPEDFSRFIEAADGNVSYSMIRKYLSIHQDKIRMRDIFAVFRARSGKFILEARERPPRQRGRSGTA
jgi:hypothetical protein